MPGSPGTIAPVRRPDAAGRQAPGLTPVAACNETP